MQRSVGNTERSKGDTDMPFDRSSIVYTDNAYAEIPCSR
jgi:hypothetical protein